MDETENHKVDFKQKTLKSIQKIILQSSKASAASYTLMASLIIFIFGVTILMFSMIHHHLVLFQVCALAWLLVFIIWLR